MQKDNKNNKRAFTIAEAAKYACVSRGIVESWIVKGLLPYEELPGNGSGELSSGASGEKILMSSLTITITMKQRMQSA